MVLFFAADLVSGLSPKDAAEKAIAGYFDLLEQISVTPLDLPSPTLTNVISFHRARVKRLRKLFLDSVEYAVQVLAIRYRFNPQELIDYIRYETMLGVRA